MEELNDVWSHGIQTDNQGYLTSNDIEAQVQNTIIVSGMTMY